MKNAIMGKLLGFVGRRLDGKKTVIGILGDALLGVGLIITGVVGLIGTMYPDLGLPALEWEAATVSMAAGWKVISGCIKAYGMSDKLVKLTAAVNETKP